jgi:hypothetical protein
MKCSMWCMPCHMSVPIIPFAEQLIVLIFLFGNIRQVRVQKYNKRDKRCRTGYNFCCFLFWENKNTKQFSLFQSTTVIARQPNFLTQQKSTKQDSYIKIFKIRMGSTSQCSSIKPNRSKKKSHPYMYHS